MAASHAGQGASSDLWNKSGDKGDWHLVQESAGPFMSFSNHARLADVVVQAPFLTVERDDDIANVANDATELFGPGSAKGSQIGDGRAFSGNDLELARHLAEGRTEFAQKESIVANSHRDGEELKQQLNANGCAEIRGGWTTPHASKHQQGERYAQDKTKNEPVDHFGQNPDPESGIFHRGTRQRCPFFELLDENRFASRADPGRAVGNGIVTRK